MHKEFTDDQRQPDHKMQHPFHAGTPRHIAAREIKQNSQHRNHPRQNYASRRLEFNVDADDSHDEQNRADGVDPGPQRLRTGGRDDRARRMPAYPSFSSSASIEAMVPDDSSGLGGLPYSSDASRSVSVRSWPFSLMTLSPILNSVVLLLYLWRQPTLYCNRSSPLPRESMH